MEILPEDERMILDILRQIVLDVLPSYCKEKISYNVPYFYGNKGICILWPASIKGGGIKTGVLFGVWQGVHLSDKNGFLKKGRNRKIFYRIFTHINQIDPEPIVTILNEAIKLDESFKH